MSFEINPHPGQLPEDRSGLIRIDRQFTFVDPYELVTTPNQILADHRLSQSFTSTQQKDPTSVYTGQLMTVRDLAFVGTDIVDPLDFEQSRIQAFARFQTITILREEFPRYFIPRILIDFIYSAYRRTPEYSLIS